MSVTTDTDAATDSKTPHAIEGAQPFKGKGQSSDDTGLTVGVLASRVAVFIAFVAAWHTAVVTGVASALIVPQPQEVAGRVWRDITSIVTGNAMLEHFLVTAGEVYMAFAIVLVFGTLLGVGIHEFRFLNRVVYPYVVAFSAMPRIAFAPLILIWFGFDMQSKVVIGVLIALFPTLVATIAGMAAADARKIQLMKALGATRLQIFTKVRFREALPYIFAGLQTSVVLSTVGVIVGEFMGGRRGLGVLMVVYQDSLDIAGVFSAIIIMSLLGLFNYYTMQFIRRRVVFWVGENAGT